MIEALEQRCLMSVSPAPQNGDFNGDGTTDTLDFNLFYAKYQAGLADTTWFNVLVRDFGKTFPVQNGPPITGNWTKIYDEPFDVNPLGNGYVEPLWGQPQSDGGLGTNSTSNVSVNNGVLSLTTTKVNGQYFNGQVQSGGDLAVGGHTAPKFGFQFGYIEVRADIPDGAGIYPQIWMLPVPNPGFHDGDGEIDLIDNGDGNPNHACGGVGVHGASFRHDRWADLSGGYHTIGVDWEPTFIQWYVDGQPIANMRSTAIVPQTKMYFILTEALCGLGWGAPPADNAVWPQSLNIDYVKVWQH